jgi:protein tyrosine phosphatase (PTP) superfamily phosphohydrolase (DUF442 family)
MKKFIGIVRIAAVGVTLGAAVNACAADSIHAASAEEPGNFVAVTERIHTAGQPTPAQLHGLKDQGYALVINLAPPASSRYIADEGMLVTRAGISYLNIPVDFRNPRYQDFEMFSNMLKASASLRVLVHCQVNKRASAFTFLYRVVHEGVAPGRAWESVSAVWVPDERWADFIRMVLKRHKIDYDPF